MKRAFFVRAVFCAALASGAVRAFAWEMGFLLSNELRCENMAGGDSERPRELFELGKLFGWASFRFAPSTSLYLKASASVTNDAVLDSESVWKIFGELENARLSVFPHPAFFAEMGRIPYSDILGLIADGAFDGATINFIGAQHQLSASALYTGLLAKETAKIFLNSDDEQNYYSEGYFAPPHLVMALSYHYATMKGTVFSAEIIRELDTREGVSAGTLFVLGKAAFALGTRHNLDAGGVFSLTQENYFLTLAASGLVDVRSRLSTPLPAELEFAVNLFWGDIIQPNYAMPVISRRQYGVVFDGTPARLLSTKLGYLARLAPPLSFDASLALYSRLDTSYVPYWWVYNSNNYNDGATGFLLGEELYAGVVWTPLSDTSLNLGAAFFFPDTGPNSVYAPHTPMRWDVRCGLLISF